MIKFLKPSPIKALKALHAFSLIEILVSLIIISLLVGAFTPVITKKLRSSEITVGNFGAVTSDCDEFSTNAHKCLMCSSTSCSLCSSQINTATGYYVDPSESCEPKKCSDKFGSTCATCNKNECTSCPASIPSGYYADPAENCVQKKCSDKFGTNCMTCTKDHCASCTSGSGYNSTTNTCEKCNGGYYSPGGNSKCEKCATGSVAAAGSSSCTTCIAANHQMANSTNTACENKYCGKGQYIENVTCKSCTGGTYQDSASHQSTTCKTCSASSHLVANATTGATGCTNKYCGANQYIDGVTCKTCSDGTYQTSTSHQNTTCTTCPSNCSACTSATKCTGCTGSYTLNADGKCVLGCNPETVTLSGTTTQVTRFNMGDDPQCPRDVIASLSGVTFVPAGTSCTGDYCCWYGTTASSACTDKSGGIYSGCNRTVCKWWAANKICTSIGTGWKLSESRSTMASWSSNSKAASGLMLCSSSASGSSMSKCSKVQNCTGSYDNYCYPYFVWAYVTLSSDSSKSDDRALESTSWNGGANPKSKAFSVRCVK